MTSSSVQAVSKCSGNGGKRNSRGTPVKRKYSKNTSKLLKIANEKIAKQNGNKAFVDRQNNGLLLLNETPPVDLVLPKANFYRVVKVDDFTLEKNNQIDLSETNNKDLSGKIGSHVSGNGEGKAPSNSPFFSVTKKIEYARRFARFLMQQHDVLILCFSKLEVLNPLDYLKGATHIGFAKGAGEYLVVNEIPVNRIMKIYSFKKRIFESREVDQEPVLELMKGEVGGCKAKYHPLHRVGRSMVEEFIQDLERTKQQPQDQQTTQVSQQVQPQAQLQRQQQVTQVSRQVQPQAQVQRQQQVTQVRRQVQLLTPEQAQSQVRPQVRRR